MSACIRTNLSSGHRIIESHLVSGSLWEFSIGVSMGETVNDFH